MLLPAYIAIAHPLELFHLPNNGFLFGRSEGGCEQFPAAHGTLRSPLLPGEGDGSPQWFMFLFGRFEGVREQCAAAYGTLRSPLLSGEGDGSPPGACGAVASAAQHILHTCEGGASDVIHTEYFIQSHCPHFGNGICVQGHYVAILWAVEVSK